MTMLPALTLDEFKLALPDKLRRTMSQELVDQINKTLSEPEFFESYRDNLVSYTHVMQEGKFSVEQYLAAVKYVSYKLMGSTHIDAYSKTFPDKIARFAAQGVVAKDIASYVTAYNKSKLVNLIYAQTMIPSHVLNQELYQRALNVQADLMMNAKSEKVRTDAANSLLTQLKVSEIKKVELNIGVKEDSSITQLRQATLELAAQQKMQLQAGLVNARDVAHSRVIAAETFEDVESREIP